jgi:predicted exporter
VTRGRAAGLALAAAFLLGLGAFVALRLEVSLGVTHFLATESERELSTVARRIAESALTRTMVLAVGAPDLATSIRAAREWATALAAHPEVDVVRSRPDPRLASQVFALYFPRRLLFLSARPEIELRERLTDPGLRAAARDLRAELVLPQAALVKDLAGADPWQAFPRILRRFEASRLGGLRVIDDQFVDAGARSAILFLTTRHSAFDPGHQALLGDFLDRSFDALDQRFGGDLTLERSGAHRFAAASERRAREDIARVSGLSLLGLVFLFLVAFRSPRLLLISLVPLVGGTLVATALAIVVFGRVHALTLAFGATLIGVCVDYPIHYVNHRTQLPDASPELQRRLWSALAMGALTTLAGFAVLAGSDFPGVREIGLFAVFGVAAAALTTRLVLPLLMPAAPRSSGVQQRWTTLLLGLLAWLERHPRVLVGLPVAMLVLCGAGLPRLAWQDDVYALNLPFEADWVAEDERVRGRVSRMDSGRFVVALGGDDESLLRLNDAVDDRLSTARERGVLEEFRSLHSVLWSADLQRRNFDELARDPELGRRTLAALEAEGFRPEAFARFTEALAAGPPEPLLLEDLLDSSLSEMITPHRIELDGGSALLTYLRGVRDPRALEAALGDLEGVRYFDQREFLAGIYGRFREETFPLLLGGFGAVVGLLILRYRRVGLSLAVAAPALLAGASTLAVFALLGIPINLLHLLGLLLVLSIGVDYAIFLAESEARGTEAAVTLSSLILECASTVLSFGLLAASSFPALRALGATTGLGVILSLVLAPVLLLLAQRGAGR